MGKALTFLCTSVSSSANPVSSLCPGPQAQPAHAAMGDPGAPGAWDCRTTAGAAQRPDAAGDMEPSQPIAHVAIWKEKNSDPHF